MKRIGVLILAMVMLLSMPVTADVRSDIRKVQRECEDGHEELAKTLKRIDDRLERLERLLNRRR
jgi:predicted Holliday junction resolvase-like endonuclease